MKIDGEIKNVIFRNEETGYTVLDLYVNGGDLVTAVGIFPPVHSGECLTLEGEFKKSQYGRQFDTVKYFISNPVRLDSIKKYLSSGLIKGLGKVTAQNIVDRFGLSSLEVMEKPFELARVQGISLKRATEFSVAFAKAKSAQEAVIFLQSLGVSINMSLKIFRAYGDRTIENVKKNPYMLVEDIEGVGFITADSIAASMGIEKDSDKRIVAGIIHTLKEDSVKGGNTFMPREALVEETYKLLKIGKEDDRIKISDALEDLVLLGQLKAVEYGPTRAIMLAKYFNLEKSIASKIAALVESRKFEIVDSDEAIARFERENDITLHASQKEAVAEAINGGVCVITGGPGTGKTTIVKCILQTFKDLKLRTALCAPTGRAAKRLSEATDTEAKTIHRLLELDYENQNAGFIFNEMKKLPVDAVIVDEASMVDEYVANALLKALGSSVRLILVGDKDQLPSVGAGNVLADVIKSKVCPVKQLTHVYRQALESGIVASAHKINSGIMPEIGNKYKDFFFISVSGAENIKKEIVGLCTERLPKFLGIRPYDVQVLCPMRKGADGTTSLNAELQSVLNPKKPHEKELYYGDTVFRAGDKVMQTQNNYQLAWTCSADGVTQRGLGVFNGDIGEIVVIDDENFIVRFEDGREANYTTGDLEQLSLAYATTIHKSQGSEFDAVVICLDANFLLQSRNLIYTAVTRAKKTAVLVGEAQMLGKMIKRSQTQRNTLLAEFLREEAVDEKSDFE